MGAADDADADRSRDRDGEGAELEAGHDRDQLGGARSTSVMKAAAASAGAAYVDGAITTGYLKNNSNPKYLNDPVVTRYTQLLAQYGPSGADPKNSFYFYGFAKAYDVVKLLYNAGKNPTRASLMKATQKMNWVNPYTIKGIKVKTSKRIASRSRS